VGFLERDPSVPADLHYYEGKQPQHWCQYAVGAGELPSVAQTTDIFPASS